MKLSQPLFISELELDLLSAISSSYWTLFLPCNFSFRLNLAIYLLLPFEFDPAIVNLAIVIIGCLNMPSSMKAKQHPTHSCSSFQSENFNRSIPIFLKRGFLESCKF